MFHDAPEALTRCEAMAAERAQYQGGGAGFFSGTPTAGAPTSQTSRSGWNSVPTCHANT